MWWYWTVPTSQALRMAEEADLDLVVISPNQAPPVAKILNYGKYKYKETKNKLYPYTGALMGFLLTRFIFENLELSQGDLQIFVSVFLFVVAIAISCNNFDLLKIILRKALHMNNMDDGTVSSSEN